MRNQLKKLGNKDRFTFTGIFERTGFKSYKDHYSPTLLLKNISKDNNILTDHLWLNYCKSFLKLGKLYKGDIIQFNARVDDYYKGYWMQKQHDYKLSYPTKVSLLNSDRQLEELPINDNHALIGYILNDNKKFYKSTLRGTTDDDFYKDAYNKWQKQHK